MKRIDTNTINIHKIPSLVLMERAAISVVDSISSHFPAANDIYVICGPGNNGGDGVAIARLLHLSGKNVNCVVIGDKAKFSDQLCEEIDIAKSYGLEIDYSFNENSVNNCDLLVDAMFGIGLTRGLEGDFLHATKLINKCAKAVLAVDMPSGYDTDTGKLLGEAGVCANLTVSFAYMKKGLLLGDCKSAAGKIEIADVGIYIDDEDDYVKALDDSIFSFISPRPVDANKGTCGKLLVIAGSESIYGACYLSAKSALATGTGLVKIFTHQNNIASIQQNLPEAMYLSYEDYDENQLINAMKWADVILIGPGLGTGQVSEKIMDLVLSNSSCPTVIDADGINLAAGKRGMLKALCKRVPVILTPHLKEMERLTDIPLMDIKYNMEITARDFVKEYGCRLVLKDSTSIVATPKLTAYAFSGNEALATPGSGDVLAGVIASFLAQKVNIDLDIAPMAAAHLHGLAGTKASAKVGVRGVLASDIIDELKIL